MDRRYGTLKVMSGSLKTVKREFTKYVIFSENTRCKM
jgi:hypothetical protein